MNQTALRAALRATAGRITKDNTTASTVGASGTGKTMSDLNKAAQDYLDSLGLEIPHVEDAAPKTFDTQDRRNKAVPAPRKVTVTRALSAPYNLKSSGPSYEEPHPDFKMGLWHQIEEKMKTPAEKWDEINFAPPEFCLFCGAGVGKFRRDGEGTCIKCDPKGVEEHNAPRAWRVWPTGSEVRVALMIAVFVLLGIAFLVTR